MTAENSYSIGQVYDPTFDNLQDAIHSGDKDAECDRPEHRERGKSQL